MKTITGPLLLPWGADFSGQVTIKPHPEGKARVVGSDVVSANQIVVTFTAGEPASTLQLTQGYYSVKMPHTAAFVIQVPSGSGSVAIGSIVSEGAETQSTAVLDVNGNITGVRTITMVNDNGDTITLSVAVVNGIADLVIQ